MKRTLLAIVIGLVLASAGAASAVDVSYVIPHGSVTVDGDLSEWTAADQWHVLDQAYSGVATDLSDAKYAARWNDVTNLIYVAISYVDTDQTFLPAYGTWNTQDCVEVYFEGSGLASAANYSSKQDYAQQYIVSPDGAGGSWATLGSGAAAPAGLPAAAIVTGNTITYEIAMTPYEYYAGLGGTAMAESIRDLAPGQVLGLDIAVDSLTSDGVLTMTSANLVGGKWKFGSAMQQHTLLVPEPATMSLLALGGLAMLRKRR